MCREQAEGLIYDPTLPSAARQRRWQVQWEAKEFQPRALEHFAVELKRKAANE